MSSPCDSIEYLDKKNKTLNKTLHQLVLGLKSSYFINIDLNWSRSSFSILYPKNYEDIAKEKIYNLGVYLHQQYKDPIIQSLTVSDQELISEVTWNPVSGRPLTKLDRDLDDIIEVGDDLEYVNISLITLTVKRPPPIFPSDILIPHLDTDSVSTFDMIKPSATPRVASISQPPQVYEDGATVISAMTMDNQVSHMETRFENIEQMLQLLVGKAQISDMVAPPNTSPSTGVVNTAPATGM